MLKSILIVFIFLLLVLIISHFKKYVYFENKYQIDQQELDNIQGEKLYSNLFPLIITFIEDNTLQYNVEEYKLYSPISICKKYFGIHENDFYYSHNFEILLVKSPTDISIEIINPKFKPFFHFENKDLFSKFSLEEINYSEVKSVEIIVHEYNIVYIPRFWIFKIHAENIKNIEFFSCHTIFTKTFGYIKS